MKIITDLHALKSNPRKRVVLAIGNFDGFHRGHRKLIRYVTAQAGKRSALSAVLTFRNHPQRVLRPEQKRKLIYSIGQKLFHLAGAKVDLCFIPSFTPSFSRMSPEVFVKKILVEKLRVLEVCMGYDARFGYRRCGDADVMKRLAAENGFLFKQMRPVMAGRKPVSSSMVRQLLSRGELEKIRQCFGRPFSLLGRVVRGKGHGTHLGCPTANLEVHADIQIPPGVYIASARFLPGARLTADKFFKLPGKMSEWHAGVANFGKRPTYPASETPRPVLEMHLFDFKGNVYGETMEIALHKFIRAEERFSSEEALKTRIFRDIEKARSWHQTH
ncbi:MAG: Riboflavin biosynthesis protein RibF [Candidatus Omnitrophica bacterium ADurb.Bin277]|nr:MAG: Riboflavin biosynthesis protein RibF [Candidatus Omnitrophica bacterium ADurb.Bin277]